MFCNRCGTQLQPEFNLCPKCGAPVGAAAVLQSPSGRLQRHLRILGIFWIAAGVLWIIPSLVLMGYSHAPHMMIGDEMFSHAFMPPMLFSLGIVFLALAAAGNTTPWPTIDTSHQTARPPRSQRDRPHEPPVMTTPKARANGGNAGKT